MIARSVSAALLAAVLAGAPQTAVSAVSISAQDSLARYIQQLRLVDVHEHLFTEEEYRAAPADDIFKLFYPYARDDLISAGMDPSVWQLILNPAFSLEERWALFEPYWQKMRTTGFGRIPLIAVRDLYGVGDISASTFRELHSRMSAARQPDWYRRVLREKAGIELIVEDQGNRKFDRSLFRHVVKFDHLILVSSGSHLQAMGAVYKEPVHSLKAYLKVIDKAFKDGLRLHMAGVKIALAYERPLQVEEVGADTAMAVYGRLLAHANGTAALPFEAVKPLQDYLIFYVCGLAEQHGLPVQIHTGMQAWLHNDVRRAHPAGLIPLFRRFSQVRFSLLHGSYPYGAELAVLAKQYPNVYFDLSWLYAISPFRAEQNLHEWLEAVPGNKIMAFGGDYFYPEQVYAQSVIARETVNRVLRKKVTDGFYSEDEALLLAARLLRDNAISFFGFKDIVPALAPLPASAGDPVIRELLRAQAARRGLVGHWLTAGPFDLQAGAINRASTPAGFLHRYAPEHSVEPDAPIPGSGRPLFWAQFRAAESGYIDLAASIGDYRMSIGYAYTEIVSRDARQVVMTFGSGDGARIWVNGLLVYDRHGLHEPVRDDQLFSVPLNRGVNHILVKVEHYLGTEWGFYLRILDPDAALTQAKHFTGFRPRV